MPSDTPSRAEGEKRVAGFFNPCQHKTHSGPDEMGDAVCADCGASVRVVLTEAGFMDAVDSVYRNYGRVSHSKRCVRLDRGWICADDCKLRSVSKEAGDRSAFEETG